MYPYKNLTKIVLICGAVSLGITPSTLTTELSNISTLANCISRIINSRLEPYAFLIDAGDNPLTTSIAARIFNISYVSLHLDTISQLQEFTWKASLYVIVINQTKDYEKFFKLFYGNFVWNPRGTFITIYLGDDGLINIAEESWKHYTLRTFIVDKFLKIYTYFPYKYEKCGENLQLEELYTCDSLTATEIDNIYTNKLPRQFNKCPFRFEALKIAPYIIKTEGDGEVGFEIEMLRAVAHYTNTTLTFENHSNREWGVKMEDGKYVHMVGDLLQRKIDGLAGMVPATSDLRRYFDTTPIHTFDNSIIFVPAGKYVETWKNFEMVYEKKVWILLFAVFISVSLALWLGATMHYKSKELRRLDYWFMYALCASCSSLPRLPHLLFHRYIIYLWVSFIFVFTSVYQCQLLTFLVKPSFEHEISSFEEVIESEYPIGGYYTIVNVLQVADPELHEKLNRKWVNCSLSMACITQTAEERNIITIKSKTRVQYQLAKQFLHPSGVSKLRPLYDKQFPFAVCFYVDKGLPYFEKMEWLINGFTESGLFSEWVKNVRYTENKVVFSETIRLGIHHLILPFVFLFTGHAAAFCVLIVEFIYYRLNGKYGK